MVNKIDDLKRILIEVRKDWIKESNSFSNKNFFTIVTLIAGVVGLYIKKGVDNDTPLSNSFTAMILLIIIFLMLKTLFTSSDVKLEYNKLMDIIIKNKSPQEYIIEKTKFRNKLMDGLLIGILVMFVLLIFNANIKVSVLI